MTTVCVPVTGGGLVCGYWGRAERVAVADVVDGQVTDWQEFEVGWGVLHDEGTEGAHHARVARFLREHQVAAVVADRRGEGMQTMLGRMSLTVRLGASGDARGAVVATSR